MKKNDDDKPRCSGFPCHEILEVLAEETEYIREIETQRHGGPAPQNPAQPGGMKKNDDDKPTGSSFPWNRNNEILADELCGMALDEYIGKILTRFGGPAPENPAQPSGGPGSASGDSKKPEIAEPLQLQGRGGPAQSPSEISRGVSSKAVGTFGSVGSLPGLECGPDCEALGS